MPLHKEGQELTGILQCPLIFCDEADQLRHQLFRQLLLFGFARCWPIALPSPPAITCIARSFAIFAFITPTFFTVVARTCVALLVRQATFRSVFFQKAACQAIRLFEVLRSLPISLLLVKELHGFSTSKGVYLLVEFPEELTQTLKVHQRIHRSKAANHRS